MNTKTLTVPKSVYLPLYDKIKERHKQYDLARIYRIGNIEGKFSKDFISPLMYNRLSEYVSSITFSFIGQEVSFDFELLNIYYNRLTKLINSEDFQVYTNKMKGSVINEQNNIFKVLTT